MVVTVISYCFALILADAPIEEKGEGSVELVHEPKQCVTTPCPQYRVLKINGDVTKGVGADLINFESQRSAAAAFKKFVVDGKWTKKDNYLEITISEWRATIREKVDEKKVISP